MAVAIIAVVFVFTIVIIKMAFRHELEKKRLGIYDSHERLIGTGASDNSMTMSELKETVRNAVEDANGPLQDQIRQLERRIVSMEQLKTAPDKPLLESHASETSEV